MGSREGCWWVEDVEKARKNEVGYYETKTLGSRVCWFGKLRKREEEKNLFFPELSNNNRNGGVVKSLTKKVKNVR